jgi:hypothetical protein
MSYDSICLMCCHQWHILLLLPLSYPEKEIGKPKEEIGNLNGFEYMYLSDLKVPYFLVIILHIHKGYFHGHKSLVWQVQQQREPLQLLLQV